MGRPNHGPRLRPNRLGIYYICWSENNRSRRRSTGTGNLPQAQQILAGFLTELQKSQDDSRRTVGWVFDYYSENHLANRAADVGRERRALGFLRASLGEHTFMDDLASEDFTKYEAWRKRSKNKQGGPINGATIRRELAVFLAAANFAVRNRKLENRHVPVIALPPPNEGKDRWLSRQESQRLLEAAQGDSQRLTRIYRFVAIVLANGKRKGSVVPLKWFQVDFKSRVIDFRRPGAPETKKRRGRAPISDWLLPILERAYREKTSEYVLDHPGRIDYSFEMAVAKAGLVDVTPHTLRHTWGTTAAQMGFSMWKIAGVLGCSIATANKNYLHHSPENLRDVADHVTADMLNMLAPEVKFNEQNDAQN